MARILRKQAMAAAAAVWRTGCKRQHRRQLQAATAGLLLQLASHGLIPQLCQGPIAVKMGDIGTDSITMGPMRQTRRATGRLCPLAVATQTDSTAITPSTCLRTRLQMAGEEKTHTREAGVEDTRILRIYIPHICRNLSMMTHTQQPLRLEARSKRRLIRAQKLCATPARHPLTETQQTPAPRPKMADPPLHPLQPEPGLLHRKEGERGCSST